jgi:divalent metal cation (Fe/Co/Zn/Cd) transporter
VLIAFQAFERIKHPEPLGAPWLSIGVIVFSLVADPGAADVAASGDQATGSNAVRADSLHYRSDMLLNGSILLALVLAGLAGIRWTPGSVWGLLRTSSGRGADRPGKFLGADG